MAPEHDPPAFASSGKGQLAPCADATPRRRPRKSQARSSRLPRLRLAAAARALSARWEREPGMPRAWSRMRLRLPAQPASRRPWPRGRRGPGLPAKARGGLAQLDWPQPTPTEKAAAHRARAGRGHWKPRPLALRHDRRRQPRSTAGVEAPRPGLSPRLNRPVGGRIYARGRTAGFYARPEDARVTAAPDLGPPWRRGKGNGD